MSDELRAPPNAEIGYHWLFMPNGRSAATWWDGVSWYLSDPIGWPTDGYRYHAPAHPDDATERARLEGEVARLRRALATIADIPLGPDHGSAQWQIDCAAQIAREALRHDPR
jgi:hypothetical protein